MGNKGIAKVIPFLLFLNNMLDKSETYIKELSHAIINIYK